MKSKKKIKEKKAENDLTELEETFAEAAECFSEIERRMSEAFSPYAESMRAISEALAPLAPMPDRLQNIFPKNIFIDYSISMKKLKEILKPGLPGTKPEIESILSISESINKAFLAIFESIGLPLKSELPKIKQKKNIEQIDIDIEPVEVEPETVETQKKVEQENESLKSMIEDLTKRVDKLEMRPNENTEPSNIGWKIDSEDLKPAKLECQIEKIPWNGSKPQLKCLFSALKKKYLLRGDIKYIEFSEHFKIDGKGKSKKQIKSKMIYWLKTERKLAYIVNEFIKKNIIGECNQHILTENHFCDKHGNRYKSKQLANALQQTVRIKKKEKVLGDIDEIVKEVVNLDR